AQPEPDAPVPTTAGSTHGAFISLSRVAKTYPTATGDVVAVEAASFEIAQGETLALLGPSGCGKTTLLLMLAGLIPPSPGTIAIGGQRVSGPSSDLGFVFQRDLLLDWKSVLANVLLPFELTGEGTRPHVNRARTLLGRVGLAGFETKRPYE